MSLINIIKVLLSRNLSAHKSNSNKYLIKSRHCCSDRKKSLCHQYSRNKVRRRVNETYGESMNFIERDFWSHQHDGGRNAVRQPRSKYFLISQTFYEFQIKEKTMTIAKNKRVEEANNTSDSANVLQHRTIERLHWKPLFGCLQNKKNLRW